MENNVIYLANAIFMLSLGFYILQNLQWYNYDFIRIFTKHTKLYWHIVYIIIPIALFFILGNYFWIYLLFNLAFLAFWYYKLDKKLVWTNRVKRFFITLIVFVILNVATSVMLNLPQYISFLALFMAFATSYVGEYMIMIQYKKLAIEKINSLSNLTIIAITASFGKTSIKNFIYSLLSHKYKVYATPRSVNTINGIISDINNNLASDREFYIVEAGAREEGDIAKITHLLNPQYAVIGEIGDAHLQYFKSIDNIRKTKYELLQSNRLKKLFLHKSNDFVNIQTQVAQFPPEIKDIESNLEHTCFSLNINGNFYDFETKLLGKFNISNLSVAILIAYGFGIDINILQRLVSEMSPIEHRLQKIEANGKIILDDSFNGNFNGVSEAIRLASLHKSGKKIIVTPGLVETDVTNNVKLATLMDNVFDVVIVTGELNSKIISQHILRAQKIILQDKANLQNILTSLCQKGDLILFANDAPSYI